MLRNHISKVLLIAIMLSIFTFTTGCGQSETTAPEQTVATQPAPEPEPCPEIDEGAVIKQAAIDYFKYMQGVNMIKAEEAKDQLANFYLIDIRKPEDFAKGHVPGAVNITMDQMDENIPQLPIDKPLLVYCYTGQTASQTVGVLRMAGFDAKILTGGFVNGWEKAGLPVEQ